MKWTPDICIAAIIVIGCLALLFCGINGEVKSILGVASGWVFGSAFKARNGNNGRKEVT